MLEPSMTEPALLLPPPPRKCQARRARAMVAREPARMSFFLLESMDTPGRAESAQK